MSVDRDLRNAGVEGRIDPQHTARIIRKAIAVALNAATGGSAKSNADLEAAIELVINDLSTHDHDDSYYKKIELQTSGQSQVDYGNIQNFPEPLTSVVPKELVYSGDSLSALVAVTDANISLFDDQTINGIDLTEDDYVLLLAQNTASDNGLWQVKTADVWVKVSSLNYSELAIFSPNITSGNSGIFVFAGTTYPTTYTELNAELTDTEFYEIENTGENTVEVWKVERQNLKILNAVNDNNWDGKDLEIENGGTGASSASAARSNLNLYSKTELQTSGQSQVHWDNLVNAPAAVSSPVTVKTWGHVSNGHKRTQFTVSPTGSYTIVGSIRLDSDYGGGQLFIQLGTSATAGTGNIIKPRVFRTDDNFESSGDNDYSYSFVLINLSLTAGVTYYLHATLNSFDSNHFLDPDTGDGFEIIRRT